MQEQLVEEQRVAGLEDRPHDRRVAGGVLGLALGHLVGPASPRRSRWPRGRRAGAGRCPAPGETSPQRDSESQRLSDTNLAHERAVLVPGAGHRRLGLAQRRLLHGDQRLLAEIAGDEVAGGPPPRTARASELSSGRVDRQHAAARLDPGALVDRAEARMRRRTPRTSPRRPRVRLGALALVEGAVDGLRERQRSLARHQPAHQQAAVAQDRRAQQLGRQVRAARSPAARRPRAGGRAGRRMLGSGRRAVEQRGCRRGGGGPAAGARWPRSRSARLASVSRSISARSSSVVPSNSAAGGGSATAAPARDPCRGASEAGHAPTVLKASAPTGRAGAPTTVAPAGTSSTTTALAPTVAPCPDPDRRR